jgi:hypothetical protein
VRHFSTSSQGESSSDGQKGYSSSKEIGNPISTCKSSHSSYFILAWANPNGGPSQDDRTSNAWKWIYPAGFSLIVFSSLVSRYRNKDKDGHEDDEDTVSKMKKDRAIRMHQAMERLDFATKSRDDKMKISNDYE